MNLACAVAHSHTLQCERLTIAFVCPPAPEPTSAAATLRVRRPREFADGLDDRIRRADAARVPNRQGPDGRAGVEPERTRRVCWLYVRRLAAGALVAEFVPKSAVPPVPARLLLLCLLFRSSWRRVEGDRHVGAAGVLHRRGGRAALAARVGVAPGVPKRLSRASRSADHSLRPAQERSSAQHRTTSPSIYAPMPLHGHCLLNASCGVWQCWLGEENLSTAVLPDPVKLPVIRSRRDPVPLAPENVPLARIRAGGIL